MKIPEEIRQSSEKGHNGFEVFVNASSDGQAFQKKINYPAELMSPEAE